MKRRMVCVACGTSRNSANDKPLHVLTSSHAILTTMDRKTECWDCGEKRRVAEEERRQKRQEAFLKRYKTEEEEATRGGAVR